jgi:hypothetical protein
VAGLEFGRAAEQRGKGRPDRRSEAAVLREGLGRYQDEAGVGKSGSTVAAVQGDEVLDVGGD